MCPFCWMSAIASVSGLITVSGSIAAAGDRIALGLGALLALLGAARGFDVLGISPLVISLVTSLFAARVLWTVSVSPQRIIWRELWVQSKSRAAQSCPTKAVRSTEESQQQTSSNA
jgi:hypothetical protein